MTLIRCTGCARHVRSTESTCPFCGLAREATDAAEPVAVRAPTRSGVMLGVAVGAVAITSAVFGSACAMYGAPVNYVDDAGHDGGSDANTQSDAP